MVQEGFYGLLSASLTWSPREYEGGSFLSYSKSAIRSSVTSHARSAAYAVRLPHNRWSDIGRLRALGREGVSNRADLAKILGISVQEVDELGMADAVTRQMGSINSGYYVDGRNKGDRSTFTAGRGEWRPVHPASSQGAIPEDVAIKVDQVSIVEHLLDPSSSGVLDERQAEFIRQRFFEGMTLEDIAVINGITRERVRQIEIKAIDKLRKSKEVRKLGNYFIDE